VTLDDLTQRLTAVAPHWSSEKWGQFVQASPDEQALMIQMLADATEPPPPEVWGKVLAVLLGVAQVAGAITGIGGAIQTVQALVKKP
jgi:hypothetical protein